MFSNSSPVRFCQARCGAGKTTAALHIMASQPGRYIYAVDRREVADDRVAIIKALTEAAGIHLPVVEIIFSDTTGSASKGIATLIRDAIVRCDPLPHAIIFITHAGLKMTTHETFTPLRWNLIVDETPDLFEMRSMDTGPLMVPFLRAHFEMQDDGAISLTRPIAAKEFDREALRPFRQFYDLVRRGGARASVTSWAETHDPWWVSRCWDASILDLFDSTMFFADSFSETIPFHVLKDEGVEFEEVFLPDHRVWRDRVVTISHYVSDHEASAGRWRDDQVRKELRKIAGHLSGLGINNHLWTTNAGIGSIFEGVDIPGDAVTPKQAGSNQWREWHDASIIYAARPSPDEIIVHGKRGMSEDDLIAARGGYDIKQFVMRLSLRDPDSTAQVTVRVYDKAQAVALKAYLDQTYGFTCDVTRIDVGITVANKPRGRKTVDRTPDEKRIARSIANAKYHKARKGRAA